MLFYFLIHSDALYSALCRRGLSFSQILVTELRNSPQNVFDIGKSNTL